MFFLVLGIIFLVPSFLYWRKHKSETDGRYMTEHAVASWCVFITAVCFFFLTVVVFNSVAYMNQVGDQERIVQLQKNKQIYETRAEDLTDRLSILLEQKYPAHEREIFKNLTPQNADLVFVAYPQLRAVETFSQLAEQIKSLRDKIYEQEVKIQGKERNIRVRERNIFYLTFLLPSS